ncbi:type II inositol 3,4-bisphosphate 4-phosphatase-like [Lampris incognitus]|uniref:type II inositol 3,4-bisphosphate 4-phosphatase-like n=1 Tax=Lampris incognitus TaxID=2546036 RepID=UPI0024B5713F|nr:type II inositol 3,4-bisphosphate 4-phosphatase-like [Lampris incognitus]
MKTILIADIHRQKGLGKRQKEEKRTKELILISCQANSREIVSFLTFSPNKSPEPGSCGEVASPLPNWKFLLRGTLGFAAIRDLLKSKGPNIPLSLRAVDGVSEVGEDKLVSLRMEGEMEDTVSPSHKCPMLCDSLHGSVQDKDNSPMMRAVLCSPVSKLYRFQTVDQRWMLVREQMSESAISFTVPKLLLAALIQQHTARVKEVKELGDLSPHWEGLRRDVVSHCNQLIGCYQDMLSELNRHTASSPCFKGSLSRSDRHLLFVPTNLHAQRMEVITHPGSPGLWYDAITVGAPADHYHGFKHGGLRKQLGKHRKSPVLYSSEECCRARELLASIAQLQPLVFGQAEELLEASVEVSPVRLQQALDRLAHKTEQFVHALKDELVRSALLAIHNLLLPAHCNNNRHTYTMDNGMLRNHLSSRRDGQPSLWQQEATCYDTEYDEEDWDRAWANVAQSINCIIAMVDRLLERGSHSREVTSPERQNEPGDTSSRDTVASWQEELLPLVVTLRECVREAAGKARAAMTFIVLQGAIAGTTAQGPPQLIQRRDAVFSQTLSAVVCGFVVKLYEGLGDPGFLKQLLSVGLLVQFEGLLSTYGEEVGMLEDMEVGVSDLSDVTFTVTTATSDQPEDLLPKLRATRGSFVVEVPLPLETFTLLPRELQEGCVVPVHPVFFNIGINQQQSLAERFGDSSLQERLNQHSCERLRAYCSNLRETLPHTAGVQQGVPDLLSSLARSVESRRRKNVEVLWLAAAICRRVKGVRLTSCKSAKDRTAMSVTLEQCVILRDQHTLHPEHFNTALDCMRREGCRMENVRKNIGIRKYAFSSVQLLTFPKRYRPPDGSYGKTDT